MEYYSAIKRNKMVPFPERWIGLETVIQSEVSQKEKSKYHCIMHVCGIQYIWYIMHATLHTCIMHVCGI